MDPTNGKGAGSFPKGLAQYGFLLETGTPERRQPVAGLCLGAEGSSRAAGGSSGVSARENP